MSVQTLSLWADTGPDVTDHIARILFGLSEPVLNAAQTGTLDEPLFVEHPFSCGRETGFRRQHGWAEVRQTGD